MEYLTMALPKGRLLKEVLDVFNSVGYITSNITHGDSRKLIITDDELKMKFILAKPTDVPTYVEHGAADIGVVGKDIILESQRDICELNDLGVGYCKLVVAVLQNKNIGDIKEMGSHTRIATSFPNIAERYFYSKGIQVEIIPLHGSIELAPVVGLADAIVDITSTGTTLRENGLISIDVIEECTARLICNRVTYKTDFERIDEMIERFNGL